MYDRRMKKRAAIVFSAGLLLIIGGVALAYTYRTNLRDLAYNWSKPALPEAISYIPPTSTAQATTTKPSTKPAAKPVPTPTPAPTPKPTAPTEINLSVPFLLQAPKQNWVEPFEDACEEASLLMVDAYYDGRKTAFGPDEGVKAILDVVAYEDATYGYNKDANADEVMKTANNYFKRPNVEIVEATEANIKAALANGNPVIAPAHGKELLNPNFRNGGPEYHMLVIKGYTKDGQWITNDPGTRNGPDYLYPKQRLLDAIHDFNARDMKLGRKVVIIIKP